MGELYDLIIVGAGPAGLSAGLYAGRGKLKTLILEMEKPGGQIVTTDELENYPGSVEDCTGPKVINRMVDQAKKYGCEIVKDTVKSGELSGDIKKIQGTKEEYQAKTVILATGANPRPIGCPGEKELRGKGVSYCATCDADFFQDMEVYVVGGGNSAVEEATYLTKFASKVTIIHRREGFRADKVAMEKAQANEKIHWLLNKTVEEIKGDGIVESIVIKDTQTGEVQELFANEDDGTFGVFVFTGNIPGTEVFRDVVATDESGYYLGDEHMKTNIEGVFVAGDCRSKSLRQVVTAASDGAIAAVSVEHYLDEHK